MLARNSLLNGTGNLSAGTGKYFGEQGMLRPDGGSADRAQMRGQVCPLDGAAVSVGATGLRVSQSRNKLSIFKIPD